MFKSFPAHIEIVKAYCDKCGTEFPKPEFEMQTLGDMDDPKVKIMYKYTCLKCGGVVYMDEHYPAFKAVED
jgi:DNA-directed RNA polymerase subunit RPC12/RpoP